MEAKQQALYSNTAKMVSYVLNHVGDVTAQHVKELQELVSKVDMEFLVKRHANLYLDHMLKRFSESDMQRAKRHAKKIGEATRSNQNDYPLNVGDDAYVTRYEHGWMNGNMKVKIVQRNCNAQGVYNYVGKVYEEDGVTLMENYDIEIGHTRDMQKA